MQGGCGGYRGGADPSLEFGQPSQPRGDDRGNAGYPGASTGSSGSAPSSGGVQPGQRASLQPYMVQIMETQVEELRRLLQRFKVGATPQPGADAMSGGYTRPAGASAIPAVQANQLPPHADILVFGPSGSGKSSLIRTFYMAFNKTQTVPADFAERIIVKDTAQNEGTLKYVSAVVKPGGKADSRGQSSSAIVCHDTRGHIWMDHREQKQLGVILDGAVKDDSIVQQRNYRYARLLWEFWKKDEDLFPNEILTRGSTLNSKPHALLFVFDGSMDDVPGDEEETKFYKDIIQMARLKGYHYPQVVLTRIDRVEEKLIKQGGALSDGDAELRLRQVLDRKIEDIVQKLDVARTAVHFIENYHQGGSYDEGRNVSVDFHALKILTQCCSHADTYIGQHLQQTKQPQCSIQ